MKTHTKLLLLASALTVSAASADGPLSGVLETLLPTPQEKAAFALEDEARVARLKNYVVGETTYNEVCGQWNPFTGLHFGIQGFSKNADSITIYMGRDLRQLINSKKYGIDMSMTDTRRMILEQTSGATDCMGQGASERMWGFESNQLGLCELVFADGVLQQNGCTDAVTLPME